MSIGPSPLYLRQNRYYAPPDPKGAESFLRRNRRKPSGKKRSSESIGKDLTRRLAKKKEAASAAQIKINRKLPLLIEIVSRIRVMAAWCLILSVFIGQLLFYTWCRVECLKIGYEITRESENYKRLIGLQHQLKIEIARLKSPERLGRIARDHLGLITPKPEQMMVLYEND